MSVFISIVSHGHSEIINNLGTAKELSNQFNVIIKSNMENESFPDILSNRFIHLDEQYGLGFGENNNIVFNYCLNSLGMQLDDYYIVLNPDVIISCDDVELLIRKMKTDNVNFAAINLYKDLEGEIFDNSIRKYPGLKSFLFSFLGLGNPTIVDKSKINSSCHVDWAAGSFLAFLAGHYDNISGFDEKYFMYCEDIDICYRSAMKGERLTYYPNIKAIHLAKHANRWIFSKHFYWHVKSAIRFLITKHKKVNQ